MDDYENDGSPTRDVATKYMSRLDFTRVTNGHDYDALEPRRARAMAEMIFHTLSLLSHIQPTSGQLSNLHL